VSRSLLSELSGSDEARIVRLTEWLVSRGLSSPVGLAVTVRWAGQVGKGLLSIETRSPVGESGRVDGWSVVLHCRADRFGALAMGTGRVGKDALAVSLGYDTVSSPVGLQS
jgi:hypothetical protein